jgi:pSer/pThr/pTyr-binding forkhead associated (FHA) protein
MRVIEPAPEEFLQACGGRAPPQLDVEHRERGTRTRWALALPFALIGRDERADLRLDDERVSHRHAYLQMVAGQLWCVDLGSRTGLHADQGKLFAAPLLPGETLRIGPYSIRLAGGDGDGDAAPGSLANPLTSEADDLASLPRIALDIRGGAAREKSWLVDRPLTLIGRAAFCKVRLHSSMVSRVHCALLNTPVGLWVVDLLGREGTYANSTALRWARLEHDDELQIDQFRMRTRFLAAAGRDLPARGVVAVNQAAPPPPALLAPPPASLTPNVQTLLLPLFAQFSEMQQQMFDQFQQSLLLMAQMFGGLQREQMQVIHQELEQLRDIARELQEVQAACAKPAPAVPPSLLQKDAETRKDRERRRQEDKEKLGDEAPPVAASTDVHLWLAQRMATLQQERQSRWQKILGVLGGK